jgi:hypothetical protein
MGACVFWLMMDIARTGSPTNAYATDQTFMAVKGAVSVAIARASTTAAQVEKAATETFDKIPNARVKEKVQWILADEVTLAQAGASSTFNFLMNVIMRLFWSTVRIFT